MSARRVRMGSSRSSRPSSRFSLVESNFRVTTPETPIIPEVFIRPRGEKEKREREKLEKIVKPSRNRGREITINESPMMLLPKARLRESQRFYSQYRSSYVVEDSSTQGLHISTIQSENVLRARTPSKSVLKSRRNSAAKSDADSGIGSLKRAVTFDNLSHSQSTVFRSDDEFDCMSDYSNEEKEELGPDIGNTFDRLPPINPGHDDLPSHLDTYGGGEAVLANIPYPPSSPRPGSRSSMSSRTSTMSTGSKRRKHGHYDTETADECEICGTVLNAKERVQMSYGKVDRFLDWVMTRWGHRRELQYIPRPSYVYRGHTPHFCNFVQQIPLHSKHGNTGDSTEFDVDEGVDFVTESVEGRTVGKWRKTSSTSIGSDRLSSVPRLDDYEDVDHTDIQNWLAGKKVGKGLFLRYFSSIPEMKEDVIVSGLEGRPGSPSSVDGDSRGDEDSQRQPVTGVEVRVTSPVKSEVSTRTVSVATEDYFEKPEVDDGYAERQSIPEVDDTGDTDNAWDHNSNGKAIESLLIPSGGDSDNNNDREPSPRQPPPSPEPLPVTVEPPKVPEPPKNKRSCAKKVRKPFERARKMKEVELPTSQPGPATVEEDVQPASNLDRKDAKKIVPQNASNVTASALTKVPQKTGGDAVETKVDLKVPDLPSTPEKKEKTKKEKNKPVRHLIDIDDDLFKSDPTDLLTDSMRQNRTEIDWSNMDNGTDDLKRPPQTKQWINGRLALSQQSSRFELPMDMKNLETMTPQEYVKKHCIITSRRQNLYQKIFLKNKDKTHTINFKDLDRTLKDVLVNTITSEQVQQVLKMLDVTDETKVDYKLFAGMAAFSERVLYPKFVSHEYLEQLIELEIAFELLGTEDTQDMPEYQKEKIESADFSALDWKFHGIKVNPQIVTILREIS